jgi:hypothetical protein
MYNEIERVTTVMRGKKETRQSKLRSSNCNVYATLVIVRTFNSTLSNINYNCYLVLIKSPTLTVVKQISNIISMKDSKRGELTMRQTA